MIPVIYRYVCAVLLIVATLAALVFVVADPMRDPMAILPSDRLLIKYLKATGYRPEVAYRYLIEEHSAPIWFKGYEQVKILPEDSDEERDRKRDQAQREMRERDDGLENLTKIEISTKYLEWLNAHDQIAYDQIVDRFILWPGQPSRKKRLPMAAFRVDSLQQIVALVYRIPHATRPRVGESRFAARGSASGLDSLPKVIS